MAYNGRDDIAQGMISFLTQHTVFADITDFEHNVVPLKSNMWVSSRHSLMQRQSSPGTAINNLKWDI